MSSRNNFHFSPWIVKAKQTDVDEYSVYHQFENKTKKFSLDEKKAMSDYMEQVKKEFEDMKRKAEQEKLEKRKKERWLRKFKIDKLQKSLLNFL